MSLRRASIAYRAFACRRGSAAAEMALVTPLFLILSFGAVDLGNYFLSEHVVVKAARDGARYASRRDFTQYSCSTVSTNVRDNTRNLVRTNTLDGTGGARLVGWTDPSTITVSVTCNSDPTYRGGIYATKTTGVPVVTVRAAVPYASLFRAFGFSKLTLTLNASAQAAVVGA
ncbi:MAG: TadE/TadG family type IV pilus assembly protein [Candidatus Sphingomonas colombiensis]|nr:TadE/TadG family type IV pilus assembly protein [Sphingomonas sp.]WEK42509.1 MAG: TadE/TadG family type IV pilus assembly protein [Sphingomonas sp.]